MMLNTHTYMYTLYNIYNKLVCIGKSQVIKIRDAEGIMCKTSDAYSAVKHLSILYPNTKKN